MKLKSILALAVLAASAAAAQADVLGDPVALSTLVQPDGSIQVGDKIFSNFGYSPTGDMPTATNVNVIPFSDADGNFGLRFQGGFHDAAGGGSSDALITYDVSVAPGSGMAISDAHIEGDPTTVGSATLRMTETWSPDADPAKIIIEDVEPGGPTTLSNSVSFDPNTFTTLHVQKDIFADAGDTDGNAAFITFVDQTYSQVPVTINHLPEPASLGTLAIGGLALLARRRGKA